MIKRSDYSFQIDVATMHLDKLREGYNATVKAVGTFELVPNSELDEGQIITAEQLVRWLPILRAELKRRTRIIYIPMAGDDGEDVITRLVLSDDNVLRFDAPWLDSPVLGQCRGGAIVTWLVPLDSTTARSIGVQDILESILVAHFDGTLEAHYYEEDGHG